MDSEYSKLQFAREILDTRRTCENCWYNRTGHCEMQSCSCVTEVFNGVADPHWWLSYEEGEVRKEI